MKSILVAVLAFVAGCASTVKVAPVTIEPIHITVDVNMHDAPGDAAHAPKR
jgi:hypothetical protein